MARNSTALSTGQKAGSTRRKSKGSAKSKKAATKPDKPYDEFPMYAHATGYWSAKVRGKTYNFGRWARIQGGKLVAVPYEAGWQEALANYKARVNDAKLMRLEGTILSAQDATADGPFTVKDLCNKFRESKKRAVESGDLTQRMFEEYEIITTLIYEKFGRSRAVAGLKPTDFESLRAHMAKRWGPNRLTNAIVYVRSVFKYAYKSALLEKPINFGPAFEPPTKKQKRALRTKLRAKYGKRTLEAEECRKLIDAAPPQVKAMVLLGLNCGFGNHDCATLPESMLDLKTGWIEYPRPKTGVERRCPLWPETVQALKDAAAARPQSNDKNAEGLVFVTNRGTPWLTPKGKADPVTHAIRKLMKDTGVHRTGLGQYTFRRTFRTVADGTRDQVACNLIMGHADSTMADHYREEVDDARLRDVADHVRRWLYPKPAKPAKKAKKGGAK